jgi:osmotically-inducible protein OsmY
MTPRTHCRYEGETSYGVVIITGEATSDAEKALVTKIAQSVRGIKSVSNNMTVKGSQAS